MGSCVPATLANLARNKSDHDDEGGVEDLGVFLLLLRPLEHDESLER